VNTIDRHAVCYAVYDARGNGEGGVAPTITGDHQNRGTDYTALAVLGNSNSNAAILEDGTAPTLLGVRGGHGDLPILLLGNRQSSDGQQNESDNRGLSDTVRENGEAGE
jgi:hypothetical protein